MHELSHTMGELLARYDILNREIREGELTVEGMRKDVEKCRDEEAGAKTAYKMAYAKAMLEASQADPLPGMTRPLKDLMEAHAMISTEDDMKRMEAMIQIRRASSDAWRDAKSRLRMREVELQTIQSLAHAYNRELKVLEG